MLNNEKQSIAIIGMACRFPGAPDINSFWNVLKNGFSLLQEIPNDRWDVKQYYDADETRPDKMYVRHGYFIDNIDQFDPQFFQISPKEAMTLDPQHRMLLEISWQAFKNASLSHEQLSNSSTGVFIGLMNHDYGNLISRFSSAADVSFFSGLGNSHHCAAGRIAYSFGLQGPCSTIDTACSSSLVAIHQACQALQNNDCHLALVGAANLILDPHLMISMCKGNVLARDGRCKTFDESADGYGRGEGCGVIILKRLADAEKDNDRILAIIRSSTVNQNGTGNGLTVPNGEAQRALLRQAINVAKLTPQDITYMEAHGSATQLGDLIEINSIAAVFSEGRSQNNPLLISSVKPNIGHLESASGIAGVIKVILALQNQLIPKHLHLKKLNPNINIEKIPAYIPLESISWERGDKRRIAGINSFGISGTNACLILEESFQQNSGPFFVENPFQRQRYWSNLLTEKPRLFFCHMDYYLPELTEAQYQKEVNVLDCAYLLDHRVFGEVLFPAAEFVNLALSTIYLKNKLDRSIHLKNLSIIRPLSLKEYEPNKLIVSIKQTNSAGINISDVNNMLYVKSEFSILKLVANNTNANLNEIKLRCPNILHTDQLYHELKNLGITYGPLMRPIEKIWQGKGESLAKLVLPRQPNDQKYYCHPVLLDGAFQTLALNIVSQEMQSGLTKLYLPIGVKEIISHRPLENIIYAHIHFPNEPEKLAEVWEAQIHLYDESGNILMEVNSLYLKHTDYVLLNQSQPNKYFYHEKWLPILNNDRLNQGEKWLIYGNPNHRSQNLYHLLSREGFEVTYIDQIEQLEMTALTNILYLESLSEKNNSHTICETLLQLLQKLHHFPRLKIFVITQGARHVIVNDCVTLHQTPVWGMIQAVQHEYRHWQLRCIDLDPQKSPSDFKDLLFELKADDQHTHIAWREDQRYNLIIQQLIHNDSTADKKQLSGTYLITGGLGGLGLTIAHWLSENNVKHIVLISRKKPNPEMLQQLVNMQAEIKVFQADVGDKLQIAAVLDKIRHPDSGMPPLHGIIHAAGILSDDLITNQNALNYQTVFWPKMAGAWNLHQLTLNDPLEHFILFSSIASVIGAPGQSNYGAANAFLDGLAHYRLKHGLPSLSINWGPWAEIGMAKNWSNVHASKGITAFRPELAAELFGAALLLDNHTQVIIADINWDSFLLKTPKSLAIYFGKKSYLKPLTLQTTSLRDATVAALKLALGFAMDYPINADDNFFALGMDSLLTFDFIDHLKEITTIDVPPVSVFQYPTVNNLVRFLEETRIPEGSFIA